MEEIVEFLHFSGYRIGVYKTCLQKLFKETRKTSKWVIIMGIKDITSRQGGINLEAEVIDKGPVREFQKFGRPGRVCTARIKDETGQCNLSLWNEQIDQVNAGDKIKLIDGYASEWQGEVQVTSGRNGTIEVVAKASEDKPSEAEVTSDEETEEELIDKPPKSDSGEKILTEDEMVEEEVVEDK
jgi:replication factor A1